MDGTSGSSCIFIPSLALGSFEGACIGYGFIADEFIPLWVSDGAANSNGGID
ncbi:hypothetical protein QJS10_CPA10g00682 [Acorus calamus]|uniref:Uncharacterized protein n=1 Tax=Acorus calamus TaxID=4465 RepID=A0AAV9DYG0_ACOCL|nr:hypothetical protein QJS10_CPA10g00682 [Acorus calamus]